MIKGFNTKPLVLIRADANRRIGSGHVMRCSAIVEEVIRQGGAAVFVVSDGESADFMRSIGFGARILPGDPMALGNEDARRLSSLADRLHANCVLVDSYGVTDGFFDGLSAVRSRGVRIAYIDDLFTFEDGYAPFPQPRAVDVVVNYSFSASEAAYRDVYRDASVACLVGPAFAPVRSQFRRRTELNRSEVERVLITSGSTNQGRLLESLVDVCLRSVPRAKLEVVVGKLASYDGEADDRINVLHDVADMASVMSRADLALSAAGSTLYELAAVGVPTIAVATTENQLLNAEGYERLGLGPVVHFKDGCFAGDEPDGIVSILSHDQKARFAAAECASTIVDGHGAKRISQALLKNSCTQRQKPHCTS